MATSVMDMDSILPLAEENSVFAGIEAHDVSSLLEQFEEASQTSEDSQSSVVFTAIKPTESRKENKKEIGTAQTASPSKAVLERLKCGAKRKGAILLPMGVPCGRGRGQPMTLLPQCSSAKIQKILEKTSNPSAQSVSINDLAKNGKSSLPNEVKNDNQPTNDASASEVSSMYYDEISDHDYCQNFPHIVCPPNTSDEGSDKDKKVRSDEQMPSVSDIHTSSDILQLDDPEPTVFDVSFKGRTQEISKTILKEKFSNIKRKITPKEYSHRQRNYRKKQESVEFPEDSGKFFDKIPSYFTTLSLPAKPPKKDTKKDKEQTNCGIKVTDYIQREISPSQQTGEDVYNKLPAYHNCFINSTKYDESSSSSSAGSMVESVKHAKYPWDRLRDKLNRDKPNSRSHSPLIMLGSRFESMSREISRSRSRSSSRHSSRSSCSSRSSSAHSSRSRSRSRGRSQRRGRRPTRRRERGHSYSSYSSVSSDSEWSYCSRSRSCSRERYYSRSRSRGDSCSRSRSPRRHQHKSRRDPSYERRKEERQKRREEEKKQQMRDRRIVYVGKIPDTYTRKELRARFERFGEIEETSVHFRESGDNYGFVTFAYTCDAYAAIEHGNKVAGALKFDLCFGGRREFCTTDYADLDGQVEEEEEYFPLAHKPAVLDFDKLLNEAKRKIKK